jgi:hypothetical protein
MRHFLEKWRQAENVSIKKSVLEKEHLLPG